MSCRCRNKNTEMEKKSQTTVQKENIKNMSQNKLKNSLNISEKKNINSTIKSPFKNTSTINEKCASSTKTTNHRIPLSDLKSDNYKPKVSLSTKPVTSNSIPISSKTCSVNVSAKTRVSSLPLSTGQNSIKTSIKSPVPSNNINGSGACKCGPSKNVATTKYLPKPTTNTSKNMQVVSNSSKKIDNVKNISTETSKCIASSTSDKKTLPKTYSNISGSKCCGTSKSETNIAAKNTSIKKTVSFSSTTTNNKRTSVQPSAIVSSGILKKVEGKVNLEKSLSNSKLPVYKSIPENKICSTNQTNTPNKSKTILDTKSKENISNLKPQTTIKTNIPVKKEDKNINIKSAKTKTADIIKKSVIIEENNSSILAQNISSNKSACIVPNSSSEYNLETTINARPKSKNDVRKVLFKSPIKCSSPNVFKSPIDSPNPTKNSTQNTSLKCDLTPGISAKKLTAKNRTISNSYTEASTVLITKIRNSKSMNKQSPLASSSMNKDLDWDVSCIQNINNITNTEVDEFWQTFEFKKFTLPKSKQENIDRFLPVYYKNKDQINKSNTLVLETSVFDGVPSLLKKSLITPNEQEKNNFGIVDLDLHTHKVHPLLLYETDLMNDIILNIILLQRENILRFHVLDGNTRLSDYRASLVDWLVKLHEHIAPNTNTFFMAVRLFDKIISNNNISESLYQILIMTTYWISVKYNNNKDIITASCLLKLCHDRFTVQQLLMTEKKALDILKYNLSVDDPMIFVYYYINIMQIPECNLIAFCSNYFLEILALNHNCNRFSLSLQAASAVYLSLKLFKLDDDVWEVIASHFGYHTFSEMNVIHKIIFNYTLVVMDDEFYPYRESYKKYSSEKYEQVSLKVAKILLELRG